MNKAKGLTDDQFRDQKADLEKEVEKIIGDIGPERVLRNRVEHTLAELLSNPRSRRRLELRLKEKN